jgi:Fe-Mn family superoxide dismutase
MPYTIQPSPFEQTPLPYPYTALEPMIDAQTMEIHYSKHAAAYATNLRDAVKAENVPAGTSLEKLMGNISRYSTKMRNNGGGHYNHELFWKCMKPGASTTPSGRLLEAIKRDLGSPEALKNQFADAAKSRFGSGWAWLYINKDQKLSIGSTPNQDNPLMDTSDVKGLPLLGLDVWEHAYYLKYQNRRPEYIENWWKLVNWSFIEQTFINAAK